MQKEETEPQYARVEQPFGCEPPKVHCPICGKPSVMSDDGEDAGCPHLAFIYVGEIGDFVYKSDDYQKRTSKLGEEDIDFDNFKNFLKMAGYGNSLLALEITYGGMACGPVWYTDVFGFDYGSLSEQEKS